MENNKNTFTKKLARLQNIYETIKHTNSSDLDTTVNLYKEGILLSKELEKELRNFEQKIETIESDYNNIQSNKTIEEDNSTVEVSSDNSEISHGPSVSSQENIHIKATKSNKIKSVQEITDLFSDID